MRIETVTKREFVLEEHEARLVLTCLDYCRHRLSTEPHTGLNKAGVKKKNVDKIATALREGIAIP